MDVGSRQQEGGARPGTSIRPAASTRIPQAGKYSFWELERRFLLDAFPADMAVAATCSVRDRYVHGSRLRLREMRDTATGETTWKFGQKLLPDGDDFARVEMTNMYVSGPEHALLASLPADELVKTRHLGRLAGIDCSVDVFDAGVHAGLVLATVDFADDDELRAFHAPAALGREVTNEVRYTGAALARAAAAARAPAKHAPRSHSRPPAVTMVPITEDRIDDLTAVLTSSRWDFFGRAVHTPESAHATWTDGSYSPPGNAGVLVELDHAAVGLVRLFDLEDATPMFDVRLRDDVRGRGLGVAVVEWLIDHVFTTLDKPRLEASTRVDNLAMRATLRRCGFVKEGHHRQACPDHHDWLVYGILRSDRVAGITTPVPWADGT